MKAVIFDIDGVLCECQQELHDFIQTKPDEDQWHSEWFPAMGDFPHHEGWAAVAALAYRSEDVALILLTNRPEKIRGLTELWLEEFRIQYNHLIMRDVGTRYSQGKRERIAELQEQFDILFAVDDDPMQVAVYREFGIPVVHVDHKLDATYERTL